MMSESILSNEKVCFRCGTPLDLHKHMQTARCPRGSVVGFGYVPGTTT